MSKIDRNNTIQNIISGFKNSSVMSAMRALENSTAISAIRAFENSPALSAMRILESSPAMIAMRTLEKSIANSAFKALEKSSLLNAKIALNESSVINAMRTIENSVAINAIKALEDSSRFASFKELSEKLSSQIIGPLTLSEAYQDVIHSYEQISGLSDIERLETLSNKIEGRVKKAPQGALSKEFYLSLILTLFLFWLSQMSSNQSEEKMLLRINQLETTISQQLSELKANEEVETYYIVMRPVNLRVRPNTKSDIITILYPNMKVRLLERASRWIKVECFDSSENVYIAGWAYKKYLKILNPKRNKF